MALTIEDGTIVSAAESFATAAELVAYATKRGLSYPTTEAEQEALLLKAMDYLVSREPDMSGDRVSASQVLPYPRTGVYLNGFSVSDTTIPDTLKSAQMEAAIAANSIDLLNTNSGQNVQSQSLGELSISYYSGGAMLDVNVERVDAYLKPLLKNTGNRLSRV